MLNHQKTNKPNQTQKLVPEVHNLFPIAYGNFSISMLRREVLVVDFVFFFFPVTYVLCYILIS